jgi:hypothetical protein
VVLVGAVILFALSSQSYQHAELRSAHSRLLRERQFQVDQLMRLESLWQQRTARQEIVPRAIAELGMEDRAVERRDFIALESSGPSSDDQPGFGDKIRAGFDRYGRISAAVAQDEREEQE